MYVIWSFEHQAWWRPGRMGYTQFPQEAGRYSKADADAIVTNANRHAKQIQECAIAVDVWRMWVPAIQCPRCLMVSYNLSDCREGYCGHCHGFHADFVFELLWRDN